MTAKTNNNIWINALKIMIWIPAFTILAGLIYLIILIITEYKPEDIEKLTVNGKPEIVPSKEQPFTIMTWNAGFGCFGSYADFFMDGGKDVNPSTKKQTIENVKALISQIKKTDADIIFIQEIDVCAKRSHYINQTKLLADALKEHGNSYSPNFKAVYVPYPIPAIGSVNSGIMTLSKYKISSSDRYALPCPFKYPQKLVNLKRCMMLTRIPVKDSNKELVLINLHLEAYDNGEGKTAQTRKLYEVIEREYAAGNYVIAGGDFNQTFSNIDTDAYPLVDDKLWKPGCIEVEQFGKNWEFAMDNSTPTCRSLDKPYKNADKSSFQYYMLDGFIVSQNIRINSINTIDLKFENSDHNPVSMNISLK